MLGEAYQHLLEDDAEGLEMSLLSNGRDEMGLTLLFACLHGASRCADLLVKQGAMQDEDVVICCKMLSSVTPITVAALLSHWELVEALVEGGAEAHAFDRGGYSALFVAAHDYPEGLLETFLSRKDTCRHIDSANMVGVTPLMMASAAAVPLLVKAGANVNLVLGETGTALLQACHGGFLEKVKALVEVGADERFADREGWTPLIRAAKKGHLHVVAYLLDRPGTDIERHTVEGLNALDFACNSGHLEVAKLLVRAGARVNPQTSNRYGPLAEAAYGGHLQVVKYLVEEAGADARRAGPDGRTPLMWAADTGRIHVVAYLLGMSGIDIDAQTDRAVTALDYACGSGHLVVVKLLVRAGAKVNAQTSNESGALASAARGGHLHVVKYLVEEAGADERHAGSEGWTPLMWAADNGHADIVAYLLGRSCVDINAKTVEGMGALDLACVSGHLEVAKLLVAVGARVRSHAKDEIGPLPNAAAAGHLHVVKYLVEEAGADDRCTCPDGWTLLMLAVEHNQIDMVGYLSKRPGINVNAEAARGQRALDIACRSGRLEIVKLLVGAGAMVEYNARNGMGALAEAASEGHLAVVKYLVEEAGADERRADEDGMTPLEVAAEMGHDDVVAYLRSIASRRDREVNG
jgi:ankyrin repeat protein